MNHLCLCDEFVDEEGLGACQKRDENFNGKFSCFVHESAGCRDVKNSTTNPEKQLSAEACEDKNESNITLNKLSTSHLYFEYYNIIHITHLNQDVS